MELQRKMIVIVLTVVILYSNWTIQNVYAIPTGDSFVNTKLDGKSLISMGKVLDKSMLTLLGLTFEQQEKKINESIATALDELKDAVEGETEDVRQKSNSNDEEIIKNITNTMLDELEPMKSESKLLKSELCKLKSCSEWTEWSTCSAKEVKSFGVKTRSRTCGLNSYFCLSKHEDKLETDDEICQGKQGNPVCPSTYTLTANHLCIRVRNDVEKSWDDAQSECNRDGGYLINIDSDLKVVDVKRTLEAMAIPDYTLFWIDGKKSRNSTQWQYEYGSDNLGLSAWYSGEPGLKDTRLNFYKVKGTWYLYGVFIGTRYFICEII